MRALGANDEVKRVASRLSELLAESLAKDVERHRVRLVKAGNQSQN
jgi:hypothetical protein